MMKGNRLIYPLRYSKKPFQILLELHRCFIEKNKMETAILHPSITQAL